MKLGLCCGPADLNGFGEMPFDFIEGHVQNHFLPEKPEKDFAPLLKTLKTAPRPMIAANCFLPADLKVTGPNVDAKRLATYADAAFRRAKKAGLTFIVFGSAGARQVPEGWSHATAFEQYVTALRIVGPIAAKHGIVGLTKVTALEGAEVNVTANAICPGYVWTPLVEKQIDDQARAHNIGREQVIRDVLLANQPNKKFATVEEMGALAVFLASDLAASITGTALPVDGGWTAH